MKFLIALLALGFVACGAALPVAKHPPGMFPEGEGKSFMFQGS